MIFDALALEGCYRLRPESDRDKRGYFTRAYARRLLEARELDPAIVHFEVVIYHRRGTRYGPVYRSAPPGETVLARAARGTVVGVALDLRPTSETFEAVEAVPLDAQQRHALYLAPGVALAFETLDDETEVLIQHGEIEKPDAMTVLAGADPRTRAAWAAIADAVG